jgi:hypothetical protein
MHSARLLAWLTDPERDPVTNAAAAMSLIA